MVIPAEAVEAAVRSLDPSWGEHASPEVWQAIMNEALEAAAPYMQHAAWDEGWEACVNYNTYPEIDGEAPSAENPYRKTAQ